MADIIEHVSVHLANGLHCSQVMMQLSLDMRGKDEPFVIRSLGALGGGMFAQRTCGTLTGAVCALSSYFPRNEGEKEPRDYQEPAKKLVEWFQGEYGSIECRDLVEYKRPSIMAVCPELMANTFEKLLEILEEYGIDPTE